MSEVARFLDTHRAIVTLQKGYSPVPAPAQKYGFFLLLLLRYFGSKYGVLISIISLNLFASFKSRSLIQNLIGKITNLIHSHDNLTSKLSAFQVEFNECTERLLGKAQQISAETAEIRKITDVITALREGIHNLFKAQQEERRKLCSLFQEIRQENIATKAAIDKQLEEMNEATKKLVRTLRELFSPLSEFNKRLKNTGGEMDQLANIIEKIVCKP